MGKITDLLHELHYLFPTKLLEMKVIIYSMGEMNIPLKWDARPLKQRRYILNTRYKEKVNTKLDQMLDAWINEPIKESYWIILMILKYMKNGLVRICVIPYKRKWCFPAWSISYTFHIWSIGERRGERGVLFHWLILWVQSNKDCERRPAPDHLCSRVGFLPIQSNTIQI